MYHYLCGSREYPLREVPDREPSEIREEMDMIRALLRSTQASLQEAEARRENLLLAMEDEGYEDRERLRELEETLANCESTKETLEALWDRADALSEELEDVLYFLRGGVA